MQPRLRFKGFTNTWIGVPLRSFVKRISKHTSKQGLPRISFDDLSSGTLVKVDNNSKSGIPFINNDVLFGKLRPYLRNWWIASFDGIATGDFWVLRSRQPKFLYALIQTEKYYYVANITSGTKMPRSDWKLVSNYRFNVPSLPEQRLIGRFFAKLDKLITLQRSKLDLLKKQKKGCRLHLFTRVFSKKPRIRFTEFHDNWIVVKFSDVFTERSTKKPESKNYPLMSFVSGVGVIPKGKRYDRSALVKNRSKKYKVTKMNDFIYSSNNFATGSIGLNKTGNAVISPVYSVFKVNDGFDANFVGIMSKSKIFRYKMIRFRQGVTYGQWRVKEKDFLNIKMRFPSLSEQHLIGTFFKRLDDNINLQNHKLYYLRKLKKAYLQKMFC